MAINRLISFLSVYTGPLSHNTRHTCRMLEADEEVMNRVRSKWTNRGLPVLGAGRMLESMDEHNSVMSQKEQKRVCTRIGKQGPTH